MRARYAGSELSFSCFYLSGVVREERARHTGNPSLTRTAEISSSWQRCGANKSDSLYARRSLPRICIRNSALLRKPLVCFIVLFFRVIQRRRKKTSVRLDFIDLRTDSKDGARVLYRSLKLMAASGVSFLAAPSDEYHGTRGVLRALILFFILMVSVAREALTV